MDFTRQQLEAGSFDLAYDRDRGTSWERTSEQVYLLGMAGVGVQVRRLRDCLILAFGTTQEEAMMLAVGRLVDLARERDGLPAMRAA